MRLKSLAAGVAIVVLAGSCVGNQGDPDGRSGGPQTTAKPLTLQHPVTGVVSQWAEPPQRTPSVFSVDGPLLGNGDLGVTMGAAEHGVSLFLSKNDFWRFANSFPAGTPKVFGTLDISADSVDGSQWSVDMEYLHPRLTGEVGGDEGLSIEAWVAATENVLVVRLESETARTVSVAMQPASSDESDSDVGEEDGVSWAERRFERDVSRPTAAATALRVSGGDPNSVVLEPGQPAELMLSMASRFDTEDHRAKAIRLSREADVDQLWSEHSAWWEDYWNRSVVETNLDD